MAKLCALFVVLVTFSVCDTQICSVTLQTDLPDREPVYLKETTDEVSLWAPDGPALIWNSDPWDTVLLCSGTHNILSPTNLASSLITCEPGNTFEIQGKTKSSKQLKCSKTINGSIAYPEKPAEKECAQSINYGVNGTVINLGFDSRIYKFITYIQSCVNISRASVLWTKHTLPGKAIRFARIGSDVPWRSDGMPGSVTPASSYTQNSQPKRLTQLLGSQAQAIKYVIPGTNQYLSRGHLTPNGDGIFRSWKNTSFHYINAIPQWRDVNAGNWNRVEIETRKVAEKLQEDLLVIQGTYEILKLPHKNGAQIPITLEENGIEVPRWVWKIVKSPSRDAGIAFVTLNNPYKKSISRKDYICKDICRQYGWYNFMYSQFPEGFTYCCDPNELINVVKTPPVEGKVGGVLPRPRYMVESELELLLTTIALIMQNWIY